MLDCIVMDIRDNVATVLEKTFRGDQLIVKDIDNKQIGTVIASHEIPFAHKISLKEIQENGDIIKYGQVIGKSIVPIRQGEYVHIHNVISVEGSCRDVNK